MIPFARRDRKFAKRSAIFRIFPDLEHAMTYPGPPVFKILKILETSIASDLGDSAFLSKKLTMVMIKVHYQEWPSKSIQIKSQMNPKTQFSESFAGELGAKVHFSESPSCVLRKKVHFWSHLDDR